MGWLCSLDVRSRAGEQGRSLEGGTNPPSPFKCIISAGILRDPALELSVGNPTQSPQAWET